MEKLKSDVVKGIRGCLISMKGKVTLRHLDNDYSTLLGEKIPFRKLGYKSLEEFLSQEPSLSLNKGPNGEVFVSAKASEKSAHISDMVTRQKSNKKPSINKVRFQATRQNVQAVSNWRPKFQNRPSKFPTSSRPAAVSHNQFVERMPSVPSKIVAPDYNKKTDSRPRNGGYNFEDGSSALANKKRMLSKMESSFDRDSGNSSPTNEKNGLMIHDLRHYLNAPKVSSKPRDFLSPSFKTQTSTVRESKFFRTDDPKTDLENFVKLYNLGELDISVKEVKLKTSSFFSCKIKVDKHCFTSYPEELSTAEQAIIYTAEEALKDLVPKFDRRRSLLLAGDKEILQRIPPMLEKHNHGIWDWQLQLDFMDKYNEQLPKDWLKIIDSSPCVQIEKCSENYILRHCKPGDVLQKGLKWNPLLTLSDVSVPSNTVSIGDEGRIACQITCILAANEIWCRQCDNQDCETFDRMVKQMESYYSRNERSLRLDNIAVGGYYVAKYDSTYIRVRAVEVNDKNVLCFFIDFGDETLIDKQMILQLKRDYATLQAQAFVCRLVGLEELYEFSKTSESLNSLLYKEVILEIADEQAFTNDVALPVYMSEINGKSINAELISKLTMETAQPVIGNVVCEVFVSNVEEKGDLYLQVSSKGLDKLQELLKELQDSIKLQSPNVREAITRSNSKNRLYMAKYKNGEVWYRVKIIDWAPQGDFAQIYLVDYGNTDVVNVKNDVLYPLDRLSDVLSLFPEQAVRVRLSGVDVSDSFVAMATRLMPPNQTVLARVVGKDKENIPLVEVFKRSADDLLVCVNKSIAMEFELKKGDGNNNKLDRKKFSFDGNKNVPSGGFLEKPLLPKKGDFYDVRVSFAVNPYNFFVQPLSTSKKLNELMNKLQDRYAEVQFSPLKVEDIIPGHIYASKYDDGIWYRTSVLKVIHSGSVSVFYCDFGYYANLTVQQLVPLDKEFTELPHQALKAKLSEIKPKHSNWSMEDCDYFKQLVEKKYFCSTLTDIEKDKLYESDIVLNLILIDTSGDEDIYIKNLLADKGIAVIV